MIAPIDLKHYVHHPNFGKKEQLVLILATDLTNPHTTTQIRAVGRNAGIRNISDWNISDVARRLRGDVIRGDQGWELTQSGQELAQQLLLKANYNPAKPAATSSLDAPPLTTQPTDRVEVFISHAAQDQELAANLVRLLSAALGLRKDQIRCTSVPGCKLPSGADAADSLVGEIASAPVFIGLITPLSVQSAYVLFELGARWGMKKRSIPLLGLGADYGVIPAPIKGRHALKAEARTDLQQMLREIADILDRTLANADAYEEELASLLSTSKRS